MQLCMDSNLPCQDFAQIYNLLDQAISIQDNDHPLATNPQHQHMLSILQMFLEKCANINRIQKIELDSNKLLSGAIISTFLKLQTNEQTYPLKLPQPLHNLYLTIFPYITLSKILQYIKSCTSNDLPTTFLHILNILYDSPIVPNVQILTIDPFLVVTNKEWISLATSSTNFNALFPGIFQNLYDHVTTLHATKLMDIAWQTATEEHVVLSPHAFQNFCVHASTSLEKWAISPNFLNFTSNHNLQYNTTPPCCPEWPAFFKSMVQIPDSSVGLQYIEIGNNPVAWMVFIARLSSKFPPGYFDWKTHPLLAKSIKLEAKGKVLFQNITELATQCKISLKSLFQNQHLIPYEMSWSTKEKSLWHYVEIQLNQIHHEIKLQQYQAGKILRNNLFARLAFIKFYKNNKSPSTFNKYQCRHCNCTLKTLYCLSKTICIQCEVISCQFCYKIQFTPFNKYCNECTNIINALDDPEFDVEPSNSELPSQESVPVPN